MIRNRAINLYYRFKIKLQNYWKELLLILAFFIGITLILWGISDITGKIIFKFGYGIILLGLCGYKFIFKVFADGIYTLSQEEEQKG